MSEFVFRWVLDSGMPHFFSDALDLLHADNLSRTPGPVGLMEATNLKRTLVTRDKEFLGPWTLPLTHNGIVVLEGDSLDAHDMGRNLSHLEFQASHQQGGGNPLANRRFLIKMDRAILEIGPDGYHADFEPWKRIQVYPSGAPMASPAPT